MSPSPRRSDFRTKRLFIEEGVAEGVAIALDRARSNYLLNVLRLKEEDEVLVFDGRNGEWRARLEPQGRKDAVLVPVLQEREQTEPGDLHLIYAPLKLARAEYMIQKAVELGVSRLQPVITDHTQARAPKSEKVRAYTIEAAEQCGVLSLPDLAPELSLDAALDAMSDDRQLIFCDELHESDGPLALLRGVASARVSVLIGPEGGFSATERQRLCARHNTTAIPLGPRILRADTAAVAALTLVQAALGDWQ